MDNDINCKAGVIQFPNGKTCGGKTAQAKYKITLREEFIKMNRLAGTINL